MLKVYYLNIPPYTFKISSEIKAVQDFVEDIYCDFHISVTDDNFIDFNVKIEGSKYFRKWLKPQVHFYNDDNEPFFPLPFSQAHAFLEWGMNWCVATNEANYLIIHSAVLAKDDKAIIFPASSGSGKSTLTAYLVQNGWRLLSDEMTIIELNTRKVIPFVRPISLKNNSINLVKEWFPHAHFSAIARDTEKGDVALVKPSDKSIACCQQSAEIVGIIFPKYSPNIFLDIHQLEQTDIFMQLANNAFNYNVIGEKAFSTLSNLATNCPSFEIYYNNLSEVEKFLNEDILTHA